MKWLKEDYKFLTGRSDKEQNEFEKYNNMFVIDRIRWISIGTVFLSFFFAYVDWIIIKNGTDRTYTFTLIVMHIICVAASGLFLVFYKWVMGMASDRKYLIISNAIKIYAFLYVLFGAISSINSQRYTGNIYSYIILLLIAAIAFIIKPLYMLWVIGVNHIVFAIGTGYLCRDFDQFLANLVNATVFAGAAFLLNFLFYRNRMKDYSYRKKLMESEESLSKYAFKDALTGILNRRGGLNILEELMEEAKDCSMEFVLCFLDINDLKYVNDTYGHREGDSCILAFCNFIKDKLAEEDVFFRMGGDEFIIIFRNMNKSQAEHIWEQLVNELEDRNHSGEFVFNIMVSHGMCYYRTGMDINLEQMIERADKMMYREKWGLKK